MPLLKIEDGVKKIYRVVRVVKQIGSIKIYKLEIIELKGGGDNG